MPSQFINDPEARFEEASSSPPPMPGSPNQAPSMPGSPNQAPPNYTSSNSGPPRRVTRQQQTTMYSNPCCCNCTLTESVIWIAVLEIIWNLLNLLVQITLYITAKDANKKVSGGGTVDSSDLELSKFFTDFATSMVICMILFGAGIGMASLLMLAVASRLRGLCYAWIGGIFLVAVGHVINMIVYNYSRSYQIIFWLPLLIYFAIVVAAYANEILLYPEGPPIVVRPVVNYMNSNPPVVYGQPVVYGGYGGGYGYGYPPGYGYGYHAGDAAVAGLALGMGAGMMMGGCDYGYGGCGFYDDCIMF